jgi:hypothetical protein
MMRLFSRDRLTPAQHAAVLAERFATAIESDAPPRCPHNVRPSCPKCQRRAGYLEAAAVVRAAGGAS